jgi:hypothetical protein
MVLDDEMSNAAASRKARRIFEAAPVNFEAYIVAAVVEAEMAGTLCFDIAVLQMVDVAVDVGGLAFSTLILIVIGSPWALFPPLVVVLRPSGLTKGGPRR